MRVKKERPKLRIVGHYMVVDGEQVEIDPYQKDDLPDRCKLAWLEMLTGQKHEFLTPTVD